jgi:Flp pilus assembly protein TadG
MRVGFLPNRAGGKRRRATATVELAVLLPFLIALFVFAADFARVFYVTITLENALSDGSLFGGQVFDNQNQQWIGMQYWQGPNGQLVSVEKVAAELDGANLNPALADSNVNISTGVDEDGNPVNIVTVTYTFSTIVAYPGIPSPVTITRTAQVRIAPATPS